MNTCTNPGCDRDLDDAAIRGCWRCGLKADPQAAAQADFMARKPEPRERGIDGPLWIGSEAGHRAGTPAPLPSMDQWGNLDQGEVE